MSRKWINRTKHRRVQWKLTIVTFSGLSPLDMHSWQDLLSWNPDPDEVDSLSALGLGLLFSVTNLQSSSNKLNIKEPYLGDLSQRQQIEFFYSLSSFMDYLLDYNWFQTPHWLKKIFSRQIGITTLMVQYKDVTQLCCDSKLSQNTAKMDMK